MPLTVSFTAGQNPLYPNIVVISDTSTGTDSDVTQRRAYVLSAEGENLVPTGTTTDYTEWDIDDDTLSLNILTQDIAASVRIEWLDVGNDILYTDTEQFTFRKYTTNFLYYLVQLNSLTPNVIADLNYDQNVAVLWSLVRGAINAVEENDDIAAAQGNLNRATKMRLNEDKYF